MQASSAIRFKARLLRPAADRRASWTFLVLPKAVSAKLGTRASVAVEGRANGYPFRATLVPDGWVFRFEAEKKDASGAVLNYTLEGKIDNLALNLERRLDRLSEKE